MTDDRREDAARRALEIALRTATPVLATPEDAADVAQEVALDVLKSLDRLRDPDAFDAWTRRIAVRHTMRAIEQRRRHPPTLSLETVANLRETHDDESADSQIAARSALAEALKTLPAKQSLALVLRYVFDLTDREIAHALGCRRGTANALLSRGRATLRELPAIQHLAPEPETTR